MTRTKIAPDKTGKPNAQKETLPITEPAPCLVLLCLACQRQCKPCNRTKVAPTACGRHDRCLCVSNSLGSIKTQRMLPKPIKQKQERRQPSKVTSTPCASLHCLFRAPKTLKGVKDRTSAHYSQKDPYLDLQQPWRWIRSRHCLMWGIAPTYKSLLAPKAMLIDRRSPCGCRRSRAAH